MVEEWIIGEGGTINDGVNFTRVIGTRDDVKQVIITYINEAKQDDRSWLGGTSKISQLYERKNGSIYGYADFEDYRIDWEALPLNKIYTYGE